MLLRHGKRQQLSLVITGRLCLRADMTIPDVLLYDVHHLWLIVLTRQEIVGLGNPSVASHCLVMGFLEQM